MSRRVGESDYINTSFVDVAINTRMKYSVRN